MATWHATAPDVAPDALALALQAAALGVARQRADQFLELVWTGPETQEIPLRQTAQALLDAIRAAKVRLTIVSFAVMRVKIIEDALIVAARNGRSIRLIAESPTESAGQLSASAANQLGAAAADRIEVYAWPLARRPIIGHGRPALLHAKCAIADDRLLFISSANITDAALGVNMELGVLVHNGPFAGKVQRHFDSLISLGHLIRI